MPFVPSSVRYYNDAEPPATLPITLNGHEICRAIFYDGRYSFYLPEKLERMLERGSIEMRFVFGDDMSRESWSCRPGANLIRIQAEPVEVPVPQKTPEQPVDENNILEL